MKKKMLNARQVKYVKNLVKGKSKIQAALAAGYAPSTAMHAGEKVETEMVKSEIVKAFERAGLNSDSIAKVCKDAMSADKIIPLGEGATKTVEDHKTRLDAAELVGKFRGDFKEIHELSGPNGKPIEARTEIIIGGFVEKVK